MRLFLFFIFIAQFVFAQDSISDERAIEIKPKFGFLAAHRGTMGHLYKDRVFGAEITFSKRIMSSKNWAKMYKNPFVGCTLYGSNLGNNEILGFGFGVYGFVEFPFVNKKAHIVSAKISAGLGYVSKVFDPITNNKNVAISTPINALLCFGLQGRWKFTPENALIYSFDVTHFSNASTKVPNLGLNMPFIGIGYAHNIAGTKKQYSTPITINQTPFFKNWNFHLVGIISKKAVFPTGGKDYPVYAINSFFSKRFKQKVGMEFGFDFISKQSLFRYKAYIPKTQWSIFQVGTYAAYVLPFDKLKIILGMGAYLKDRYDADNEIYHRVGMRYQCDNGLLLNLVLKSHWAKADYAEWGIGYTFNYKK